MTEVQVVRRRVNRRSKMITDRRESFLTCLCRHLKTFQVAHLDARIARLRLGTDSKASR
jgi:hypothetical protein